ncbi:MAG: hypothetical protein R3261_07740 [Alphaproteobacteria bacterium]|nr:hypothetical protein [Alphaproteobacteria bacterium]
MKKVLIGLLAVIVIFAGAIAFIYSNLDAWVKEAVETVGSEVTQTAVTLDSANVDPANGKAALNGLVVGNPVGFETEYAVSLGGVSVKMDPTTVTGDVILINEVVIDKPSVIYEMNDNGSNVDALQANVDAFIKRMEEYTGSSSSDGSSGSASSAPSEEATSGPKFIIENLYIRDASTTVNIGLLGGKNMSTPAIDIHLTDIGKKEGGVLAAEAAAYVMDNLFNDVSTSVANVVDFDALGDTAKEAADAVGKAVESLANEGGGDVGKVLEDLSKDGGEGIGNAVKDAEGALNSIFGNSSN